jgi:hypothetical protein
MLNLQNNIQKHWLNCKTLFNGYWVYSNIHFHHHFLYILIGLAERCRQGECAQQDWSPGPLSGWRGRPWPPPTCSSCVKRRLGTHQYSTFNQKLSGKTRKFELLEYGFKKDITTRFSLTTRSSNMCISVSANCQMTRSFAWRHLTLLCHRSKQYM